MNNLTYILSDSKYDNTCCRNATRDKFVNKTLGEYDKFAKVEESEDDEDGEEGDELL